MKNKTPELQTLLPSAPNREAHLRKNVQWGGNRHTRVKLGVFLTFASSVYKRFYKPVQCSGQINFKTFAAAFNGGIKIPQSLKAAHNAKGCVGIL